MSDADATTSKASEDLLEGLPAINGAFEIGIAAGADPSIADNHKLVFQHSATSMHATAVNSAVWALRTFPGSRQGMYVTCAYCAVYFGLIAREDGDWLRSADVIEVKAADVEAIKPHINQDKARIALSVMIATKINWWVMNHHTGTGSLQGYSRKVAITLLNADTTTMAETATFMHTVGHWCSTKMVLTKLKMIPSTVTRPISPDDYLGQDLQVSMDIQIRLKSLPAGTHKHGVAEGIMKRLLIHPIAKYSNVIAHARQIADSLELVRREPYAYHIGARYLTGADRKVFNDADAENFLGRLGTFASIFAEKSTLFKSPHVKDKFMNYEDYDEAYLQLCRSIKLGAINMDVSKILKGMASSLSSAGSLKTSFVNEMRSKMGIQLTYLPEPAAFSVIRDWLTALTVGQPELNNIMKDACMQLTDEEHEFLMYHSTAIDVGVLPTTKPGTLAEMMKAIKLSYSNAVKGVNKAAKKLAKKKALKAAKLAKTAATTSKAADEEELSSSSSSDSDDEKKKE